MRRSRRVHGMTVVELMVTLALAAILVGLALPGFLGFMAQQSMTTAANDFYVAATMARSEATKRRARVSLQAVNAGDNANEWGPGWCVTVGTPGNCNNAIRVFDDLDVYTLNGNGNFNALGTLTFDDRGILTLGLSGTLDLCHPTENPGRRVTISAIGRASIGDRVCP